MRELCRRPLTCHPAPERTSSTAPWLSLSGHSIFLKFKTKFLSSDTDSDRLSVEISSDELTAMYHVNAITRYNILVTL